jgi:integrase
MRDEADKFESFSCHCFRHTFATRCFEAGVAPKTVQSYLGHASLQMTMDLYTHVTEDKKLTDIQLLEEKMEYVRQNTSK